jgi:ribonuclease P protein component
VWLRGTQTLGKQERLRHGYEFRRVYEEGEKVPGRLAVLYVRKAAARALGVVTSRRLGKAVARNRARRLLREAYRRNKARLNENMELVIVARRAMLGKRLAEVERELMAQFAAAGLLKRD